MIEHSQKEIVPDDIVQDRRRQFVGSHTAPSRFGFELIYRVSLDADRDGARPARSGESSFLGGSPSTIIRWSALAAQLSIEDMSFVSIMYSSPEGTPGSLYRPGT